MGSISRTSIAFLAVTLISGSASAAPLCAEILGNSQIAASSSRRERALTKIFEAADVQVGGARPEDITVNDPGFYDRILRDPTLEIGETYMDGLWDSPAIDRLVAKLYSAQQRDGLLKTYAPLLATPVMAARALALNMYRYARDRFTNRQTRSKSKQVAEEHYDLGNDLYIRMLDATLAYTSGIWRKSFTLEDAQNAKYDSIARKLGLKAGDRVLDIGCGFGGFARYAAKYYGARVTGITISVEQLKLARTLSEGYPNVDFVFSDYRDIPHRFPPATFDHVVSVEMVEAVGVKNLSEYFQIAHSSLKDGGRFVMQAISNLNDMVGNNPWVDKYIFPNGVAPSLRQYDKASATSFGNPVYRHDITADYDNTLMSWNANFTQAWPDLRDKYGARFKRMWDFYLLAGAGIFRSREQNLHQVVYVKGDHRSEVTPVFDVPEIETLIPRRASEAEKEKLAELVKKLDDEKAKIEAAARVSVKKNYVPLNRKAKVLVIGAGPGGLSAARELEDLGFTNVTVLEAGETTGGKTHTLQIDGRPQDFGATVGFNGKYNEVIALAKENGQETVPLPPSHFYDLKSGAETAPETLAQSLKLKIQGLKYFLHHLKLAGFTEKGLEVPPAELADSWYVSMGRLGANEFAQEMKKYLEGFGYGDDSTPAVFAYRLFDLKAVLGSPGASKPMMWANGTQPIWQGVASRLSNVRTGSKVTKMVNFNDERGVEIYVNNSSAPERYDKVVVAIDPKSAMKFLDPNSEIFELFSLVKYMPYATFAVRVDGFSGGQAQVGYLRENMARRFGRPMAWIKRYADQNTFIFHLFAPPEMSNDQIVAGIADDISKLGGRGFTYVDSRRWPFFPHVDSDSIRENRFFERVRNQQGRNNTVYINEALGMSTMPDAALQGRRAAQRLASGEY